MKTVIVAVFKTAGLTDSETEMMTMLLWAPNQAPQISPLVTEAAGQRYRQPICSLSRGSLVFASADI